MSVQTSVHLPEDLYERLRREAFDRRTSQSAIVTEALTAWLDAQSRQKIPEQKETHD